MLGPRRWLAIAALCGLLPAQGPGEAFRLLDRVTAPLLHIGLATAVGEAGLGESWIADLERLGIGVGDVGPSGDAAGTAVSDPSGAGETSSSGHALRLLQRLLAGGATGLAWNEVEFALTGILPRRDAADLPLLVFRAKLEDDAAEILRGILADGQLARPARRVSQHDVYELSTGGPTGPGSIIELALTGADLIVSNHAMSMDQVLDPRTRSEAEVLSANPVYRSLSGQLEVLPGTLVLYADIGRLRHRIGLVGHGSTDWLLGWSGLGSARGLLMGFHRAPSGTRISVLLGTEGRHDGWLDLVQRLPAQDLVQRVPVGGLGGIAFGWKPAGLLAARKTRGNHRRDLHALSHLLRRTCAQLGLSLEDEVLPRLGPGCTVQFLGSQDDPRAPQTVVSLQGKNRGAAGRLFVDIARSENASAAVTMRRGARGSEQLDVQVEGAEGYHLGVIGDSFSMAFHDAALDQVRESTAAARRDRASARRDIFASLKWLGVSRRQPVAGVFQVDLAALVSESSSAAGSSPLVRRHVGYLQIEPGLLRVEILGEN